MKKICFIVFSQMALWSLAGHAQQSGMFDTPNRDFEKRIHKMFQKGLDEPIPDSQWSEMIGKAPESYKIQQGDTLWDISDTMFGEGKYWPKLWSENTAITNPHQVTKKRVLKFVAGTESDAPRFSFEDNEVKPSYVDEVPDQLSEEERASGVVIEDESVVGSRPVLPAPAKTSGPMHSLPRSFKPPIKPIVGNFDNTGVDSGPVRARNVPAELIVPYFVGGSELANVGKVDEIEASDDTASQYQYVFISVTRPAKVGDIFTTVSIRGEINDRDDKTVGNAYEVGGVVKVVREIDGGKGIYRAMVIENANPVRVGSILLDQPPPRYKFVEKGERAQVAAHVIGGEFDESRTLFALGGILYLDAGEGAGVKVGQLLAVSSLHGTRKFNTENPDVSRTIGVLKIVHVSSNASTALVLRSSEDIHTGDITGGAIPTIPTSEQMGTKRKIIDLNSDSAEPESR